MFKINNEKLWSNDEILSFRLTIESMSRDDLIRASVCTTPIGLQNMRSLHAAYKDVFRATFATEADKPLPPDLQCRIVTKNIDEVEVVQ